MTTARARAASPPVNHSTNRRMVNDPVAGRAKVTEETDSVPAGQGGVRPVADVRAQPRRYFHMQATVLNASDQRIFLPSA